MANQGHNVADINKTIRKAAQRIIKLKAEKAEIQAVINEVKSEVKSQGIKLTDFNIALRVYELEGDDRNETLDNLRICFEALGLGHQSEMFPEKPAAQPAAGNGQEASAPA